MPKPTNVELATATQKMINEADFLIPNKMARNFVHIDDWLINIMQGQLVVVDAPDPQEN